MKIKIKKTGKTKQFYGLKKIKNSFSWRYLREEKKLVSLLFSGKGAGEEVKRKMEIKFLNSHTLIKEKWKKEKQKKKK